MTLNRKLTFELRQILDNDFKLVKIDDGEGSYTGAEYYANGQKGADKIMLLVTKYSHSLEEILPRFQGHYSRRLAKYDNYQLSEGALDDIIILTEELIQKLEIGLIKIKRFNFNKELNPFELGLLWLLGILGFSDIFQKLLNFDFTNISLRFFGHLILALTLKSILFFVILFAFLSLLIYFRYEP